MAERKDRRQRREELQAQKRTERLDAYNEWVSNLFAQLASGALTQDEFQSKIARAMYAMELQAERSRRHAHTDGLTGLANKTAFRSAMREAARKMTADGSDPQAGFAILIVDADHFKQINDAPGLGHPIGDKVLVQLGLTLATSARQHRNSREGDVVARWGGEEFAILLHGVSTEEDLRKVAEKHRKAVSKSPFSVRNPANDQLLDIPMTVSVGGGIYRGGSIEQFFSQVDAALYQAKKQGRNQTVLVQPGMQSLV